MIGGKYRYALDEQDRVMSIKEAYLEGRHAHSYHCIGCGAEMIPRLGDVRSWHFAHKGSDDHCGQETYLHKLAKRQLKEKFEKEGAFEIGFYRKVYCSDMKTCPFAKKNECLSQKLEYYDLKKYYDTCFEEKSFKGHIADLLLTNSKKPEREPVFIEIQVTHKSSVTKIESGVRIIEIRIKTEEDLESLIKFPIVENPNSKVGLVRDVETIGYAKFYGFKRPSSKPEPLECRWIPRFYMFRSGIAYVTNMDEFKSCRTSNKKEKDNTIFEASLDCSYLGSPSPYMFGYMAAIQKGIQVRTCLFCTYHINGFEAGYNQKPIFCPLFKKYGTPRFPEPQHAGRCQYYREDERLTTFVRHRMPPMVIASDI